jgi:hypothetical protein
VYPSPGACHHGDIIGSVVDVVNVLVPDVTRMTVVSQRGRRAGFTTRHLQCPA